MRHYALLSVLMLMTSPVLAETDSGNPYFFGGKCTSQGNWTAQALAGTQEMANVARRLKEDPKCSKLADTFLSSVEQLKSNLGQAEADQGQVGRLQSLSREMSALGQFASQKSNQRVDVISQLLGRAVGYASEVSKAPMSSNRQNKTNENIAENLFNTGQRLHRTANTGLDIFNSTIQAVAGNSECALDNTAGGTLFAASVNVLSSFASSGQNFTGVKLSQAISNLFSSYRNVKFSKIIRNANETALMNSISCLLEMTSESYCSARDARALYEEAQSQTEVTISDSSDPQHSTLILADKEKVEKVAGTPLEGFYIITQQLPVFNEWLMKVIVSADPQLVTDGQFRNSILDDVNNHFKKVNELKASYNNKVATISGYTDPVAQLNAAIQLIGDLSGTIIGNQMMGGGSNTNFFTQSGYDTLEIPFVLAGIPVPREVMRQQGGQFNAMMYLQNEKESIPNFKNAGDLINQMKGNLEKIIDRAQLSATAYYNQWAIMDKQSVVDSAMLGVNFNVKEVLVDTNRYLEGLKTRLSVLIEKEKINPPQRPIDPNIIGSILDTQMRLKKIAQQLSQVKVKSEEFQKIMTENQDEDRQMEAKTAFEKASKDFLIVLYDQFSVSQTRTGFLANRMSTYVQYDFQSVLRDQTRSGKLLSDVKFEQSLKYAVNMAAYNQMLAITSNNPASVRQDIANSMNISKGNIRLIEDLFKDFYSRKVAEERVRSVNNQPGSATLELDSYRRIFQDYMGKVPTEGRSPIVANTVDKVTGFVGMVWNSLWSTNRYNAGGLGPKALLTDRSTVLSSDTEFGTAKEMHAQYCVQALAFNDLRGIWSVCKDAKMLSPFAAPKENDGSEAYAAYDKYLNVTFAEKAMEDFQTNRPLNESKRICALREYYRRNLVLSLTRRNR